MRLDYIKNVLRPYSIVQKRKTTINGAFASAIAPCDEYDEARLAKAMAVLGQHDLNNLYCVYCREPAETWDHLVGLVKNSELNGYGHQVGNLVPCCKSCNSRKGNKDWRQFLQSAGLDTERREAVERMLSEYLRSFAVEIDLLRTRAQHPAEWERYAQIKGQIIKLMTEADQLAGQLRIQVKMDAEQAAANVAMSNESKCG